MASPVVQRARAFFVQGDVLVDRNTFNEQIDGCRLRVDKVGVSYFDATVMDGALRGQAFLGRIPTRARDIVELTDTTLTMRLDGDPDAPTRLRGHTVTYTKGT